MGGSCRCMRERRSRNERSRSAADPARTKLDAVSSCADADGDDLRTADITNLMNLKQQGYQLNMLLCYCIGAAASRCEQFYLLPAETKMLAYERIGVNAIIANQQGGISSCDIPFDEDLDTFNASYQTLSEMVRISGKDHEIADHMIVGTSALIRHELDGVVNMYSGIYHNPFLIWGRYRQEGSRFLLQISFQFHHVQMDGLEACAFLDGLQRQIDHLGK